VPFVFEVLQITQADSQQRLRGRIASGAYFGPELVVARSQDGREHSTCIVGQSFERPVGWPVLPEHKQTLMTLTVPTPPDGLKIAYLEGLGVVVLNANRVDVSQLVGEAGFWAGQMSLHFMTEQEEDPGLSWLGIDSDSANDWYERRINSHFKAGRWPFVRVALPGSRYIELEMAGAVEFQDRIWIGDDLNRVLLGYHSGHFSLPALRAEEVSWIASVTDNSVSNLLWLSAAYVHGREDVGDLARDLALEIPGHRDGAESEIANALLKNRTVEDLLWTHDPRHGWINNSVYSQRNPKSRLSTLRDPDFEFIAEFFSDCIRSGRLE